jgi:hypothetical protein
MSASEIPILIETEKTIHDNSQIRSNLKLNSNKRKNSSTSSQPNKKIMSSTSSIDFEKFNNLNTEYEKIFEDSLKTIENLRREKQELYEDSIKIIRNLQDEISRLQEKNNEAEEKFKESSALVFFLENWFGQAFENAKNLFYNYYYYNNNIEENIYIDHKTPLPTIFNNLEENSDDNYSSRMSTPDIYDEYEFDD